MSLREGRNITWTNHFTCLDMHSTKYSNPSFIHANELHSFFVNIMLIHTCTQEFILYNTKAMSLNKLPFISKWTAPYVCKVNRVSTIKYSHYY